MPGKAEPRRTSGGKAGKKVLLGQSYALMLRKAVLLSQLRAAILAENRVRVVSLSAA